MQIITGSGRARLFLVAGLLFSLPLCLWHLPVLQHILTDLSFWHDQPCAGLWFLAFAAFYCSVGLPKPALSFTAGLAFGVWEGGLLTLMASQIGACVSYSGGRMLRRTPLGGQEGRREAGYVQNIKDFMCYAPFRAVLVLRLMPVGSALLLSWGAGMLRLPFGAFIMASFIGSTPHILVFVLVGAGGHMGHYGELVLAVSLFLLSGLLGLHLLQQYRNRVQG